MLKTNPITKPDRTNCGAASASMCNSLAIVVKPGVTIADDMGEMMAKLESTVASHPFLRVLPVLRISRVLYSILRHPNVEREINQWPEYN